MLLGWEISAFHGYGPDYHDLSGTRRRRGRLVFDWRHPLKTLLYFLRAAVPWAYPGLFYLFFLKIAWNFKPTRRLLFRTMGPEAVERVQLVPLIALFHQIAGVPLQDLKTIVARLWEQYRDDQVIFPEDIAWVRDAYPKTRIVVSSASPQPCLEFVRDHFRVDDVIFTGIEEFQGRLSTPHLVDLRFMQAGRPRRISPPGRLKPNSARNKVSRLFERFPDMAEPGVETVGITDTKYGEDHAWAGVFHKVADLNSDAPFPPIVAASSPLREIHSAVVLTLKERSSRKNGQPCYWDERRKVPIACDRRSFSRDTLAHLIGAQVRQVEMLERMRREKSAELDARRQEVMRLRDELAAALEEAVDSYNNARGKMRRPLLARIKRNVRTMRSLDRRLARLERPLAKIQLDMYNELELSRKLVDRRDPRGDG